MTALPLLLAAGCAAASAGAPGGRWAHDPAPSKHLFVDNALFAGLTGDLGLVSHRPAPAGIVLTPSEPWESYGYIGCKDPGTLGTLRTRISTERPSSVAIHARSAPVVQCRPLIPAPRSAHPPTLAPCGRPPFYCRPLGGPGARDRRVPAVRFYRLGSRSLPQPLTQAFS